jgi:hypothetical protein
LQAGIGIAQDGDLDVSELGLRWQKERESHYVVLRWKHEPPRPVRKSKLAGAVFVQAKILQLGQELQMSAIFYLSKYQ